MYIFFISMTYVVHAITITLPSLEKRHGVIPKFLPVLSTEPVLR